MASKSSAELDAALQQLVDAAAPASASPAAKTPPFPKIEAPPQHPKPRSRQTSTSSDFRLRSGSENMGDQFFDIDASEPVVPLSGNGLIPLNRRPAPQMARLTTKETASPIGVQNYIPANESRAKLALQADERNDDDGEQRNIRGGSSDEDEGITVVKPLTAVDSRVRLPEIQESVGLSKEELQQFVDDPKWKRIRLVLFVAFWVTWLAMLLAAAVILAVSPKCPPTPKLTWWQKTPLYRVDVETYLDSDGDGVGDVEGLITKLDYIRSLNIHGVILDGVFKAASSEADFAASSGDALDFLSVNEAVGTTASVERLLKETQKRGMHVVVDFDAETTSVDHPWFKASRASKSASDFYRDFYVWSSTSKPGADWSKDETRGAFYSTPKSGVTRAALNLQSPTVRRAVAAFVDDWSRRGVEGFSVRLGRIDAGDAANDAAKSLVAEIDEILDEFREKTHRHQLLMLNGPSSSSSSSSSLDLNAIVSSEDADVVLSDAVLSAINLKSPDGDGCDSRCLKNAIDARHVAPLDGGDEPKTPWKAYLVGGPEVERLASRVHAEYFNAYVLILGLLPGTPVLYYGDEVAMKDGVGGVVATPMQWTPGKNAGFTTSKSGAFRALAPRYEEFNVEVQLALGADHKQLQVFKETMNLRQRASIAWGAIFESSVDNQIYSYLRQAEGFPGYLVAANVGKAPSLIDFMKPSVRLPASGVVVMTTRNLRHDELAPGTKLRLDKVYLRPGEGVVIELEEEIVMDEVVVNGH